MKSQSDQTTFKGNPLSKLVTSCAECRRSKLKCNRSFPCQPCIRRGCADMCPGGTMPATKGNRALVLRAQMLTEEADELKSRIRELEAAIISTRIVSASSANLSSRSALEEVGTSTEDGLPELSSIVNELVAAFPLGKKGHDYSTLIFEPYMPLKQSALHNICLFYEKSSYFSNPMSSEEFFISILNSIYPNGETPSLVNISSHSLSVFFATIALGLLCDTAGDTTRSEQYHNLARAALSFQPLSTHTSCATVQAVFLMSRLAQKIFASTAEECWLLNGINNRLIHKLGLREWRMQLCAEYCTIDFVLHPLDYEGPTPTVLEHERQAERRLFWEVVAWDAWACFVGERPGYFSLKHVNCPFPVNTTCQISGKDLTWSIWRYKFITCCVTQILDYTLGQQDTSYAVIADIDNKIRSFPLPTEAAVNVLQSDSLPEWHSDGFNAVQEFMALSTVEGALICLHKKYFLKAMSLNPADPFATEYRYSARTTLDSASRIILGMIKLYQHHASEVKLTWFLWVSVFISTNILRDFAMQCPRCPVSKTVLHLHEKAMALYDGAMTGVADGHLAKLHAYHGKAYDAVFSAGNLSNVDQLPLSASISYNTLLTPENVEAAMHNVGHHLRFEGQTTRHKFQDDIAGSTQWSMQHDNAEVSRLDLPESVYNPLIYVPEGEFGYQQQWDTQHWEDFAAAFDHEVPGHEQ